MRRVESGWTDAWMDTWVDDCMDEWMGGLAVGVVRKSLCRSKHMWSSLVVEFH